MKKPDHRRVIDVFNRTLELPPEQRQGFLDEVCGGDRRLREEVESLLVHDGVAPRQLNTGSFADSATEPARIPRRIGPYEILAKLGEGGMGVVYLALQKRPIERKVAIKLMRFALAGEPALARFDAERQVLARLDHPCIARVIDAGTTSEGTPFVVMEHVDGLPITEYCDRNRLGLEQRLELFVELCEAVQHAHRQAVIHRDLKPSNVLVTEVAGRPRPKVIDFGIAKVLSEPGSEQARLTRRGELLGTLEYMSPEQAGTIDHPIETRSDVYSLGMLLYRLVAGTHPFDDGETTTINPGRLAHLVGDIEPPRPSARIADLGDRAAALATGLALDPASWRKKLQGDLDWIVTTAISKEPDRRYGSAAALASDLGRFLDHAPVHARPPSVLYRLGKFTRRHRVAVGLATVLFATLLLSASSAAIQARRVSAEKRAVERLNGFLLSLFDVRSGIQPRDARFFEPHETLTHAVENARREMADNEEVLARVLHAAGEKYAQARLHHQAIPLLREAHAVYRDVRGEDDGTTLAAALSLASALTYIRSSNEAEAIYEEVLRVTRAKRGLSHADTFRAMGNLGYHYKRDRQPAKAVGLLESAAQGLAGALGDGHREVLYLRGYLAGVYMDLGRHQDALPLLLDLVQQLPAVDGGQGESAVAFYNLGCVYANLGRSAEALEWLKKARFNPPPNMRLDPHTKPLHGMPEFEELSKELWVQAAPRAIRMLDWAKAAAARGDHDGAERALLQLIAEAPASVASKHQLQWRLGDLYLSRQRYAEAETRFRSALELLAKKPGLDRSNLAIVDWYLVQSLLGQNRIDDARAAVETMLAYGDDRDGAIFQYALVMRLALEENWAEAVDELEVLAERPFDQYDWLRRDLAFGLLRGDPRFEELTATVVERSRF